MEQAEKPTPFKVDSIESPDNEAAPEAASFYLNYWSESLTNHQESAQEHESSTSSEHHRSIRRVNNWYRRLGCSSLDPKVLPDLLDGHRQVYSANQAPYEVPSPWCEYGMEDIDLRQQPPTKALYLQGCLLHEAALLSDGEQEQWLLDQARNAYDRVTYQDSELGKFQLQEAIRHMYDIDFHKLTIDFQHNFAEEKFDETQFFHLLHKYESLQQAYIYDFLHWSNDKRNGEERSSAGILFEWLTVLTYRQHIWRNCSFAETEIRAALPREDQPIRQRKKGQRHQPKRSFDVVTHHYMPTGEIDTEYIQCKISKKNEEYLPTMARATQSQPMRKVIAANSVEKRDKELKEIFRETAIAMSREYDNSATDEQTATVTELQQLFKRSRKRVA